MEIIPATQSDLQYQMQLTAIKHAERSKGMLTVLPHDEDRYPGQSLMHPFIECGNDGPLTPDISDAIAAKIDSRYPALLAKLNTDDAAISTGLDRIEELLKFNVSVIIGTDHAELLDVSLENLAIANHLRRRGVALRSGIIASKMIDFLGVSALGDMPVRDVLALGFDKSFLTIPRTRSTDGIVEETAVQLYNKRVTHDIRSQLRFRQSKKHVPFLLSVALPGTINKPSVEDSTKTVIGRVSPGILRFTSAAMLVDCAVRLDQHDPKVYIGEVPRHITEPEDITVVMRGLTKAVQKLDNKPYIYDADGTLSVIDIAD